MYILGITSQILLRSNPDTVQSAVLGLPVCYFGMLYCVRDVTRCKFWLALSLAKKAREKGLHMTCYASTLFWGTRVLWAFSGLMDSCW